MSFSETTTRLTCSELILLSQGDGAAAFGATKVWECECCPKPGREDGGYMNSGFAESPATGPITTPSPSPSPSGILIAVMGATGSGKGFFCRAAAQSNDIVPRGDLNVNMYRTPGTQQAELYTFHLDGLEITLIDTPNFDATVRNGNTAIPAEVARALRCGGHKKLLDGIIYLHPITADSTTTDFGRSTEIQKLTQMFEALPLGGSAPEEFRKVVLTTNRWGDVRHRPEILREAEDREEQLRQFWRPLTQRGAKAVRLIESGGEDISESAWGIIRAIVRRNSPLNRIQEEEVEGNHFKQKEVEKGEQEDQESRWRLRGGADAHSVSSFTTSSTLSSGGPRGSTGNTTRSLWRGSGGNAITGWWQRSSAWMDGTTWWKRKRTWKYIGLATAAAAAVGVASVGVGALLLCLI